MKTAAKRLYVFVFCFALTLMLGVLPAYAQISGTSGGSADKGAAGTVKNSFSSVLRNSGLYTGPQGQLPQLESGLGKFIASVLALIGVATFALVVYAGALWITAAGNEERIDQSKRILMGAVLGLVIIFSAYMLVNFALTSLQTATSGGGIK